MLHRVDGEIEFALDLLWQPTAVLVVQLDIEASRWIERPR
jgi:hypothetical protein